MNAYFKWYSHFRKALTFHQITHQEVKHISLRDLAQVKHKHQVQSFQSAVILMFSLVYSKVSEVIRRLAAEN